MSQFSQNLRRIIATKELNPTIISEETGVSNKTIHGWLVGKSPRSIKDVYKVSSYLQVSLDYLFTGEDYIKDKNPILKPGHNSQKVLRGSFKIILDE